MSDKRIRFFELRKLKRTTRKGSSSTRVLLLLSFLSSLVVTTKAFSSSNAAFPSRLGIDERRKSTCYLNPGKSDLQHRTNCSVRTTKTMLLLSTTGKFLFRATEPRRRLIKAVTANQFRGGASIFHTLPSSTSLNSHISQNKSLQNFSVMSDISPPSSHPSRANNENTTETTTLGSKHSRYEMLVRRLYMTNLFNPVKLGLENIERLHEAMGNPMDNPNLSIIHIAGTNGKGSVAFKIAKTLELSGHNVGLFVSPHISSFRERMTMNSIPISESEVEELLPKVFDICEKHKIPATFFEITSALAFCFFASKQVDAVVLETGLGGRLDATNVVKHPVLSVITTIGLEHTRILGDTLELIAREKGGIIKKGRPVLVGDDVPHDVLRECAREKEAKKYYTCEDVLGKLEDDVKKDMLLRDYDMENARIASAAVAILRKERSEGNEHALPSLKRMHPISDQQIEEGISHRPPCRFELIQVYVDSQGHASQTKPFSQTKDKPVQVVLDVAHNPPAMHHLLFKLRSTFSNIPKRFVAGFSNDKNISECIQLLLSASSDGPSGIHFVQASHPRAATFESILESCPEELTKQFHFDKEDRSITSQIRNALQLAKERDEVLVVCGSVFLMAEAREALGFEEPMDSEYISEVAGCNLKHGQENFKDDDLIPNKG